MHHCLQNYYKKNAFLLFYRGRRRERRGQKLPPSSKCSLIVSHVFQSSVLEDSLVSIFRCRISKYSTSGERSTKVPRADAAHMLFITCPLLFCSLYSTTQSLHTICHSSHMPCAFLPCLSCLGHSTPPSAKCQKCTAFLKAWIKYHLSGKQEVIAIPSPACLLHDSLYICPLPEG